LRRSSFKGNQTPVSAKGGCEIVVNSKKLFPPAFKMEAIALLLGAYSMYGTNGNRAEAATPKISMIKTKARIPTIRAMTSLLMGFLSA
jgi:hypothetical protein